jgi:hypothetical protein
LTEINLNANQVTEFVEKFKEYLGFLLTSRLAQNAPVDTGFLRNSVDFVIKDGRIEISMADYAKYIEFGTNPHEITPKNGKALKWKSGGKDVFAKKVMHPGTRPNPFIRTTFFRELDDLAQQAAQAAYNDVAGAQT